MIPVAKWIYEEGHTREKNYLQNSIKRDHFVNLVEK
jgi:hypothetical protein